MKFLSALEQARWHIRTLWFVVVIMIGINVLLVVGWIHSQSKISVQIPPRIPESGLMMRQGDIPDSTVYSFAYYVWQSINHWSNDGLQDYQKQITQFSPFLTPDFKLQLIEDYNNLLNQGELQDRIRLMEGASGSEYMPSDVDYIGHDTWLVHLKMRLTELMNSNAKVVKDIQMLYTLKIVRFDIDAKQNPWGLAMTGFAEAPERIKTII